MAHDQLTLSPHVFQQIKRNVKVVVCSDFAGEAGRGVAKFADRCLSHAEDLPWSLLQVSTLSPPLRSR
jgi:hypothetical protein